MKRNAAAALASVLSIVLACALLSGCLGPSMSEEQALAIAGKSSQVNLLTRFDAVYSRASACTQGKMDSLAANYPGANSSFLFSELQSVSSCGQTLSRKASQEGGAFVFTYSFSYARPSCGSSYDALKVTVSGPQPQPEWLDASVEKDFARVSSLVSEAESAGDCGLAVFFLKA